jgi:hypothetical protein
MMDVQFEVEQVKEMLDNQRPGLFQSMMDKTISQDENYLTLVDKEKDDKDLYAPARFQPPLIARFRFLVLSSSRELPPAWYKQFYTIEVLMKDGTSAP